MPTRPCVLPALSAWLTLLLVGFCSGLFVSCWFLSWSVSVSVLRLIGVEKALCLGRTRRIRDSDEELAGPQPEPEPEEQLFTSRATKRSKAAAEAEAAERARQPEPQYDDEET